MIEPNVIFIRMNDFVKDPIIKVENLKKYVLYGEDNLLPQQLITNYRNIGIHRAIIDKKKKMFLGNGIDIDFTDEASAKKTYEFLTTINRFEDADTLFDKIAVDLMLFGGTYLQIIWENGGNKIAEIFHMSYEQIRASKKDEFGMVQSYYYNNSEDKSKQWKKYTDVTAPNIIEMPKFNIKENKKESQILYIHNYEPGFDYYSLPDYIGALRDLNTLAAISDFHNSNIHNSMQPGLIFKFKGEEPSQEAKDKIVASIKNKYGDTISAGKSMIFWLNPEDDITTEQSDTSKIADMYKLLSEDVKENIVVAHQIPRAVTGMLTPGSLGNTKELLESIEIIKTNYIEPIQNFFLKQFNKLMTINSLNNIILTSPSPNLMQYSLSDLSKLLTQNEIREYIGFDPIGEEKKKEDVSTNVDENK